MAAVRTVLGDLPPGELGVTDAHGRLFPHTPPPPGREPGDGEAAEAGLRAFRERGGGAVARWTPYGTGRRGAALAALSRATGVHLVAATGLHRAAHYGSGELAAVKREMAGLFVEELTAGLRDAPGGSPDGAAPRAGMVTVAGALHGPDAHAVRTMTAAAEAHHATGAPVGVDLGADTAAAEVLELLCGRLAVPPASVLLGLGLGPGPGRAGRFPDSRAQREAAASGAYLVFGGPDGPGGLGGPDAPDGEHRAAGRRLPDTLADLAAAGHAERLLLGGAAGALPAGGLRPRVARELGGELADLVLVHNPARAYAADWRA
ncbi:phosphotriesterase [Streptomyces sp. DH37]|nr:phosphotriesterase [Streptomyces sp. DH37]MDG9705474.1 phosphotriesterase [Streptomyces sp. DH37]